MVFDFFSLFDNLNRHNVRYLVAGGLAVNLYGVERMTGDIDLAIHLEPENIKNFLKTMEEMGFTPRIPVPIDAFADASQRALWVQEKGMVVFSLYLPDAPYVELDIFAESPFNFEEVYTKRIEMPTGTTTISVVPIETLISMKEKVGRPQDIADCFHLRQVLQEDKDE